VLGHRQIQKHDVRLKLAGQLDGFRAIAGFSDDFEIRFCFQQTTEAIPKNGVVIGNDQAYWL
jgi:hypothetical protein